MSTPQADWSRVLDDLRAGSQRQDEGHPASQRRGWHKTVRCPWCRLPFTESAWSNRARVRPDGLRLHRACYRDWELADYLAGRHPDYDVSGP